MLRSISSVLIFQDKSSHPYTWPKGAATDQSQSNKVVNVVQGAVMRWSTIVRPSCWSKRCPLRPCESRIRLIKYLNSYLNINILVTAFFFADSRSFPSSAWWEGTRERESLTWFISLAEDLAISWKRNKGLWEEGVQESELYNFGWEDIFC